MKLFETQLELQEECACDTSLVKLDLTYSELSDLHQEGVSACSNLEALTCLDSLVNAQAPAQQLNSAVKQEDQLRIAVGLSSLTRLSTLDWEDAYNMANISFGCLSGLVSLQHLSVRSCATQMSTGQLGALTNLTYLDLESCDLHSGNVEESIDVGIEFQKLTFLHLVSLHSKVFTVEDSISGLLNCKRLGRVQFSFARLATAQDVCKFAGLVHGFAQSPAVKFSVGDWNSWSDG